MPENAPNAADHGQVIDDPNAGYVPLDVATIQTPFDGVDLNDLDTETAKKVTKGIEEFKSAKLAEHKAIYQNGKMTGITRKFQSEHDKAMAELKKSRGQQQSNQPQFKDDAEHQAYDTLVASGYNEEQIKAHLPLISNVIRTTAASTAKTLGAEFAPVAMQVLHQRNSGEFQQAAQSPTVQAAFADPTVSQEIWDWVSSQSTAGQNVNADVIANYAKILMVDKGLMGGHNGAVNNTPPTRPLSNPMPFLPGISSVSPLHRAPGNNGEPVLQHTSNPATDAALRSVFQTIGSTTGVFPKAFAPPTRK